MLLKKKKKTKKQLSIIKKKKKKQLSRKVSKTQSKDALMNINFP